MKPESTPKPKPKSESEIADIQRTTLRQAADLIERGEPVDDLNRNFVATVLRHYADLIPNKKKKGSKGPWPKFSSNECAYLYAGMCSMPRFTETNPPKRLPPHSNRGAIRKLAELYDVSEKAIKDALKKEAAVIDGWKRVLARK